MYIRQLQIGKIAFYRLTEKDVERCYELGSGGKGQWGPSFTVADAYNAPHAGDILPIIITGIEKDKDNRVISISGQVFFNHTNIPVWVHGIPRGILDGKSKDKREALLPQAIKENGVFYLDYPSYLK